MTLRPVDQLRLCLLAALGLPLNGCGGSTEKGGPLDTDPDVIPAAGSGSNTTSGGSSSASGGTSSSFGGENSTSGGRTSTSGGASSGGTNSIGGRAGAGGSSNMPSGGAAQFPCVNPQPLGGPDSGFVTCSNGFVHREARGSCTLPAHAPRNLPAVAGAECREDSDCTARPNGYCIVGGQVLAGSCKYSCVSDADCDAGNICLCDGVPGCVPARCAVDGDCTPGYSCASYETNAFIGCGQAPSFACQAPSDTCGGNNDCLPGGGVCLMSPAGTRSCQPVMGACGRPFLVNGSARYAPVSVRSAGARGRWNADLEVCLDGLSDEDRKALAAHWAHAGAMEHASIAAFARFALELLALGAPAHLLEATAAALADETEHARLCFGLASAYAGCRIEPEALPTQDALADCSWESVVERAVLEGCIGETVAALEALEAGKRALDPKVRAVLERIAEDETRHAALAWRFLSWSLGQRREFGTLLIRVIHRELGRSFDIGDRRELPGGSGVLQARERAALRAQALAEVVRPTALALLDAGATAEVV